MTWRLALIFVRRQPTPRAALRQEIAEIRLALAEIRRELVAIDEERIAMTVLALRLQHENDRLQRILANYDDGWRTG